MVRGEGCYLYDADGVRYLDAQNNVAHVGHSNPVVSFVFLALFFCCWVVVALCLFPPPSFL